MFKTLADMATMRALLEAAERESAAMGEADPGAEHIVLAALAMPDGTARDALAELGLDADGLRAAIAAVHVDALAGLGITPPAATPLPTPTGRGVYRSKGSARDLLKATAEACKEVRSPRFVSAHVLLGATAIEQGTLPLALRRLGLDPARLREVAELHTTSAG